jgi:hypothetical protein
MVYQLSMQVVEVVPLEQEALVVLQQAVAVVQELTQVVVGPLELLTQAVVVAVVVVTQLHNLQAQAVQV